MRIQEKLLLSKVKHKDADAFAKVYDAYSEGIYRFIYFKVPTTEIAEDITSEVFLKVWEYLTKQEGRKINHLRAFLYTTARNKVADYYRKRSLHKDVALEVAETENSLNIATEELYLAFHGEARVTIQKYVRRLKEEYQEAVLLRFVEELSIGEIATITGKTRGSIRVTIHRGLKALREIIAEESGKILKNNT